MSMKFLVGLQPDDRSRDLYARALVNVGDASEALNVLSYNSTISNGKLRDVYTDISCV